jgi:hypothetical protein
MIKGISMVKGMTYDQEGMDVPCLGNQRMTKKEWYKYEGQCCVIAQATLRIMVN